MPFSLMQDIGSSMSMHHHSQKSKCVYVVGSEVVCSLDIWGQIGMIKNMSFALLMSSLVLVFLFSVFFAQYQNTDKFFLYIKKYKYKDIFILYQNLFSRGILNSRAF
jgi:hypothetical protein